MTFIVRPAVEADQPVITDLIRQARLNPRDLHWPHFLVAEADGAVVGIRQVRVHSRGTREVGSGFVRPDYRHQGISARLMEAILAREKGTLYLMCNAQWGSYYEQFGFTKALPGDLPPDFGRAYRLGRMVTSILSWFAAEKIRLVPMKRSG
jgi:N-acetylglutamate synthase-like GNAT family acetyltransferase